MKLPNWFRILWWLLLSGLLSYLLYRRLPTITDGTATLVDGFFFLIWIALLLLPLFNEFEFFGIKLKSQIDALKSDIKSQLADLRAEMHTTVGINSQINPQFYLGSPSDAQLAQIEPQVRRILEESMVQYGIQAPVDSRADISFPDDISYLFSIRFAIERELRRIWRHSSVCGPVDSNRNLTIPFLLRLLRDAGIVDEHLVHVIREVYAVCSPAIHGEDVSQTQVNFVKAIGPNLIATLKAIK